jgi:hypothetical protein
MAGRGDRPGRTPISDGVANAPGRTTGPTNRDCPARGGPVGGRGARAETHCSKRSRGRSPFVLQPHRAAPVPRADPGTDDVGNGGGVFSDSSTGMSPSRVRRKRAGPSGNRKAIRRVAQQEVVQKENPARTVLPFVDVHRRQPAGHGDPQTGGNTTAHFKFSNRTQSAGAKRFGRGEVGQDLPVEKSSCPGEILRVSARARGPGAVPFGVQGPRQQVQGLRSVWPRRR